MTSTPPIDPSALQLLYTVDLVRGQLSEVADRLRRVRPDVEGVVAATDWQTDTARRFHRAAAEWRHDVDALAAVADAAEEDARLLSARLNASVWAGLP